MTRFRQLGDRQTGACTYLLADPEATEAEASRTYRQRASPESAIAPPTSMNCQENAPSSSVSRSTP